MQLPNSYNYIGVFLTLRCNFRCSYCINWKNTYAEKDADYWIKCFNNIETDLCITLGGGEPSLYKGFYEVINGVSQKVDILTNLSFNVNEFIDKVSPERFDNNKTFAPIRVSLHSEFMNIDNTLKKIRLLYDSGFRVGLYCVDSEINKDSISYLSSVNWLDFQIKPLLNNEVKKNSVPNFARCRISQLLVSPEGKVYKCHRDLYKNENEIGSLDHLSKIEFVYRDCFNYGECHPCDTKIKRDRFGKDGHCAVDIIEGGRESGK